MGLWDNIKNSFFGAVSDDDIMSTLTNPDGSVTTTYRNGRKTIVYLDGRVVTTGSGTGPGGMIFILIVLLIVGFFSSNCRKVGERRGADGKMHPIMDCSQPKPQQQMYMQQPIAYAPVAYAPPPGYVAAPPPGYVAAPPPGYVPAPPPGYVPAPPPGYVPAPTRFGRR